MASDIKIGLLLYASEISLWMFVHLIHEIRIILLLCNSFVCLDVKTTLICCNSRGFMCDKKCLIQLEVADCQRYVCGVLNLFHVLQTNHKRRLCEHSFTIHHQKITLILISSGFTMCWKTKCSGVVSNNSTKL